MARYNQNRVSYQKQEDLLVDLCKNLAKLKTHEEIKNFLKDLLNRQERLMLIRRLQIAELLVKGFTYSETRDALHVGFVTIARVSRWLYFGRNGYKSFLLKKSQK